MNFISKIGLFVIAIVVLSSMAAAVTLPKTAKLLPPETVLLVDIEDFKQLKAQFEKTSIYKLYKDPAMAAFVAGLESGWRRQVGSLDKNDLFRTIADAGVLPTDRASLAFVLDEKVKDPNYTPVVLISRWGEGIARLNEAVDKLVARNIEMGGRRMHAEDYRGLTINKMADESGEKVFYCFADDVFLCTGREDLLKFVIAHLKGADSRTLGDDLDYSATMAALGPYHDIDLFLNIKQIIKTSIAKDATLATQTTLTVLGVDNVAAAGWSLAVARQSGSCWSGKTFIKVNGAKKGILKMLELEPAVIKAPGFVPASSYLITIVNLDVNKAYAEFANILYGFNPMLAAMLDFPLLPPTSPDGQSSVLFKSDIVRHLGSQIVISQAIGKSFAAAEIPEALFAVQVNNKSALEKSLSLVHGRLLALNNPDARRELLGHTIYRVDPRLLPWFKQQPAPLTAGSGAQTPPMPMLAFTITETHLIIGIESTVESAVRTLASADPVSVNSAAWFRTAKLALPTVVGVVGIENTAASTELFWRMLKQGANTAGSGIPMSPTNPQQTEMFRKMTAELFETGLLPDFDAVRKYFGSSVFYGVSRPDGLFFEFNYLAAKASE